nr:MAG: hypothetical protein [Bacteriophage sp.]
MKDDDWKFSLGVGFVIGLFTMGTLMYITTTREMMNKKDACELNIPRNQKCVMQFVPETKQTRG